MMNYIEEFVNHLIECDRENMKLPKGKRNILTPCTEAQMAFDALLECFLGSEWYVSYPAGTEQVNTEAAVAILMKHSRKFRKLIKKAKKDLQEDKT